MMFLLQGHDGPWLVTIAALTRLTPKSVETFHLFLASAPAYRPRYRLTLPRRW